MNNTGILNDSQITELCQGENRMIYPFVDHQVKKECTQKIVSYGTSSFGYDIRLSNTFKMFLGNDQPLDVKNQESLKTIVIEVNSYFDIPPGDMVLCESFEVFNMPEDVLAIALGKSTFARVGLICNVTPLEPGWKGKLVIELSNTTKRPIRVYPFEGCCQLVFYRGERPLITYADRKGKYQGQSGVQGALL